jgi:hypothetical protein
MREAHRVLTGWAFELPAWADGLDWSPVGHAGLIVTVTGAGDSFQIYDEDRLLAEVPRRTTKPIARFKARKPEPSRTRSGR